MPTEITAVHPVLMARDVAASLAFYKRLGFSVAFQDSPTDPRYARVRRDNVELHVQWAGPEQWAHAGDRPAYRFTTPDVDALFTEFGAAGAGSARPVTSPYASPTDTPWGTREFHIWDPGDNALRFCGPASPSGGVAV